MPLLPNLQLTVRGLGNIRRLFRAYKAFRTTSTGITPAQLRIREQLFATRLATAGTDIYRKHLLANVPVRTGDLRRSIRITTRFTAYDFIMNATMIYYGAATNSQSGWVDAAKSATVAELRVAAVRIFNTTIIR